jgi:hypothetical protein
VKIDSIHNIILLRSDLHAVLNNYKDTVHPDVRSFHLSDGSVLIMNYFVAEYDHTAGKVLFVDL